MKKSYTDFWKNVEEKVIIYTKVAILIGKKYTYTKFQINLVDFWQYLDKINLVSNRDDRVSFTGVMFKSNCLHERPKQCGDVKN